MYNHGQQQFFEDVIKLSLKTEKIFYFFVNEYGVPDTQKLHVFRKFYFINTEEYLKLRCINIALHCEIHCRSPHVKKRCFIGHGFPGKATVWHQENLKSFNHYFLYGPKDRKIFDFVSKNDQTLKNNITFWEVGYPKYDYQFSASSLEIEDVAREIGLNPSKKTILFAPAWDPRGILRTAGLELMRILRDLESYNIIIKLHPASLADKKSKDYFLYTGGIDWSKAIGDFLKERKSNSKFFMPDCQSINPLFKVSDVMITDFSGVALGFFLENKPVISIDCPDYFSETLKEFGSDGKLAKSNELFNNGRQACHLISDYEEIGKAIRHVLQNPNENSEKRLSIANQLLYNKGKGTVTFLKTLKKILTQ